MGDSEQPDVPEAEELISQGLSGRKKSSVRTRNSAVSKSNFRLAKVLKVLGPGLITGAADDDPSGIATYS
ncbi:MAG: hypothetical protein WAM44_00935, partial [Chthoniobacterales bacterium]